MTKSAQMRDDDVTRCMSTTSPATVPADADLACLVRQALRELAAHSPSYANVFVNRPGVRLASHVAAGHVAELTDDGRQSMRSVYLSMQAAAAVEPGLDTNTLIDRITGRRNPRLASATERSPGLNGIRTQRRGAER